MPRGIPKTREERERIPAGMPHLKLNVKNKDPNKEYYFALPHQFEELKSAGYDFELKDDELNVGENQEAKRNTMDSVYSISASKSSDEKLYLMSIPKKWYKENQKIKQDELKQRENEMFNRGDTETEYMVKGSRKEGHA